MFKKGFTLIELIVVVGILSIIMLIVSQPVASIIKYQRESQTTDNMRDNLQFIINIIEKELKTSSDVKVLNNNTTLEFKDQDGVSIKYSFDTAAKTIKKNEVSFIDKNLFKVNNFRVWYNPTTNKLVTILIDTESKDLKDKVSMQTSVYPLNNK